MAASSLSADVILCWSFRCRVRSVSAALAWKRLAVSTEDEEKNRDRAKFSWGRWKVASTRRKHAGRGQEKTPAAVNDCEGLDCTRGGVLIVLDGPAHVRVGKAVDVDRVRGTMDCGRVGCGSFRARGALATRARLIGEQLRAEAIVS